MPSSAKYRSAVNCASVNGAVVTGTWTEQTDPDGHYSGLTYHGGIQMLLTVGDRMAGQWLGYGRDFEVNNGPWTLHRVASSAGSEAIEEWNRPVPAAG